MFETAKDICKTGKFVNLLKNFEIIATNKEKNNSSALRSIINKMDVFTSVDYNNNYYSMFLNSTLQDCTVMCRAIFEATTQINQLIDAANKGDSETESLLTQFGISV